MTRFCRLTLAFLCVVFVWTNDPDRASAEALSIRGMVLAAETLFKRGSRLYLTGEVDQAARLFRRSLTLIGRARARGGPQYEVRLERIRALFFQDMVRLAERAFGHGAGLYKAGRVRAGISVMRRSLSLLRLAFRLGGRRYRVRMERIIILFSRDLARVVRQKHLALVLGRKPVKVSRPIQLKGSAPWVGPVAKHLRWLLRYRRGFVKRSLKRAVRYLPLIRRVFKAQGVPPDLCYLALIESGFTTTPTSWAGARGMWQFIPSTARAYGLKVNRRVDERLDPVKSTYAAAAYLRDLHKKFKDWPLAVAAYNCGEGRIARLLKRHKVKTFWALSRLGVLPTETRNYVPSIIAATLISRQPKRFGL